MLGISPATLHAQVSSSDIEVLRKVIGELQKQIQIQGEEIASLKNQFAEKPQPGTVIFLLRRGRRFKSTPSNFS
jgi:hypothetical protein